MIARVSSRACGDLGDDAQVHHVVREGTVADLRRPRKIDEGAR
jgi:hypothetical protein